MNLQTATFGAGCFWCVEAVFEKLAGVSDVRSGYMGGEIENPSYEQICTGRTGHAEVVVITFDPMQISFGDLLDWFWRSHDPTTLNQQGADRGTQYRSAIFYHDEMQQNTAELSMAAMNQSGLWPAPAVTQVVAAETFWPAEDYHQDYYQQHGTTQGYCLAVIGPKLRKLGLE